MTTLAGQPMQTKIRRMTDTVNLLRKELASCEARVAYLEKHVELADQRVRKLSVNGQDRIVSELTYQRSRMLLLARALDRMLEVASL